MESNEPVESDDLILAKVTPQQEGHLGRHTCTVQRDPLRLEGLCHLDRLLGKGRDLGIFPFFSFLFLKAVLTLIDFYLGQGFCRRLVALRHGSFRLVVHGLLYETLGVELFGDLDTQLEVLLDEVFKLLRPCLLPFLLKLDTVVVFDNLFDTAPEELDHLGHIVCLSL